MKLQIGIDGKTYEVEVELIEDDAVARGPHHGPYMPVPATVHSSPAPPAQAPAENSDLNVNVNDAKVCRSPVAGVVIRVDVTPGQQLQANQVIMVLEAMKMETNVTVAVPGTIKSLRVQAGDAVKTNQILAEFE